MHTSTGKRSSDSWSVAVGRSRKGTGPRNKERGREHENELVAIAKGIGFDGRRAWGSNGQSIGLPPGVDVELWALGGAERFHIQAKRQKELPRWLSNPRDGLLSYLRTRGGACHAVAFRQDRDMNYVVLPFAEYLKLLKRKGGA